MVRLMRVVSVSAVFRDQRGVVAAARIFDVTAQRGEILTAERLTVDHILEKAVVTRVQDADFPGQRIAYREVRSRVDVEASIIAGDHLNLAAVLSRGLLGEDVDDTARRISAEKRALWSAQDFDVIDIEYRQQGRRLDADRYAVAHHRH